MLIDHLRSFAPAAEYLAGLEGRPSCSEISRIEVSGPNGAPIAVEQRNELMEKLEKLIKPVITVAPTKVLGEPESEE